MRTIDWCGILERETGSKWEAADGPDSRTGVDYWFAEVDGTGFAYLNVDQDFARLSLQPQDDESVGRTVFEGHLDELPDHPDFSGFVSAEPPTPA